MGKGRKLLVSSGKEKVTIPRSHKKSMAELGNKCKYLKIWWYIIDDSLEKGII